MKWMIIVVLAFSMACGGETSEKPGGNGFDLGEVDLGMDTGADSGDPGDMAASGTIEFRLVNDTDQMLYAGTPGSSCLGYPFVKVQGVDAAQTLSPGCTQCLCSDEQCQICDCGQATADAYRFEPGTELTFEWDKRFWGYEPNSNRSCLEPRGAQFQNYSAEFCFIDEFDDESNAPRRELCTTVAFDIDDAEVSHTITDSDLPGGPTRFRLVNNREVSIFARPSIDGCYGTWLSVSVDGQQVQRNQSCGVGLCSEGGGERPCPGGACAPPMRETYELPRGEARTFSWNHVYWQTRDLEGTICEWPGYARSGEPARAEMCWSTEIVDSDTVVELGEEQCETIEFDTSDDLVEYIVE